MKVGWDRGADRASNDADVSTIPPIIPYGGFSPVRLEGWLSSGAFPDDRQLKPAPGVRRPMSGLHPPFVHLVVTTVSRTVSGRGLDGAPPWRSLLLRPRGPRSGPSYAVSNRQHLVDPIRPTRGHTAISPHGGLYAMPSLCGSAEATREWFRAFAAHSFLTCHPLRPRGARHRYCPVSRCRHGLRRDLTGSTLPSIPQSDSRGGSISWLHWFATATACQVACPPGRI
jgi:hypothetical protein